MITSKLSSMPIFSPHALPLSIAASPAGTPWWAWSRQPSPAALHPSPVSSMHSLYCLTPSASLHRCLPCRYSLVGLEQTAESSCLTPQPYRLLTPRPCLVNSISPSMHSLCCLTPSASLHRCLPCSYSLVGLEQTAESSCLPTFEFPSRCVLVLGREKEGIPPEVSGRGGCTDVGVCGGCGVSGGLGGGVGVRMGCRGM